MSLDRVKALYKVDLSTHPVVEVQGPEHREWLHRISSQGFDLNSYTCLNFRKLAQRL